MARWNETASSKSENNAHKKWQRIGEEADREYYKQKSKQAKREVAVAKRSAWEDEKRDDGKEEIGPVKNCNTDEKGKTNVVGVKIIE